METLLTSLCVCVGLAYSGTTDWTEGGPEIHAFS